MPPSRRYLPARGLEIGASLVACDDNGWEALVLLSRDLTRTLGLNYSVSNSAGVDLSTALRSD